MDEGRNVQSEKPREGQGSRTGMTKQQGWPEGELSKRKSFKDSRLGHTRILNNESSQDSSPFAALGFCELWVQLLVLDSSQSPLWSPNSILFPLQKTEAVGILVRVYTMSLDCLGFSLAWFLLHFWVVTLDKLSLWVSVSSSVEWSYNSIYSIWLAGGLR